MAENNLLQSNPGNATTRDWDENERRQSEFGRSRNIGNYENTGYGSEFAQGRSNYGNQQQQESGRSQYGQQGQNNYAQGSSGYGQGAGSNYGQGSYGQQNWNPSQDYNRGGQYGQQGQGYSSNYGQQQQNWGQDYNQSRQQNWSGASQDYGRGSYGHYGNMGSSYGGNYGEGRSSYQGGMGSQDWGRGGYGAAGDSYGPYNQSSWRPQGNYNPAAGYQSSQDGSRQGAQGSGWGNERQNQSHRGRGPRGYNRSDERITEDVNDRLSDDPTLDASDIEVKVNNGEITLQGSVESREAKRRAEDIAESISGVQNVENRIRVKKEQSGREGSSSFGNNTERTGSSTSSTERSSSKSGRS